jgi:ribosome-binding factor A
VSRPRQPPKQYPRVARLNEVVMECLAEEVEHLSDPRLGFVTITGVEIAQDLRTADVFYSVFRRGEAPDESAAGLASAAAHLRTHIGREIRMKYSPELRFIEDESVASGERIEAILRTLQADGIRADDTGGLLDREDGT